jgi:hypothetical protein
MSGVMPKPAAAFYAQLSGPRHGMRPCRVERAGEPHGASEAAVTPFGQVEPGVGVGRRGELRANHEERAAPDGDAQRIGRHARHVHDDFDRPGRLDDVERRPAVCRDVRDAGNVAVELEEQPAGVLGQVGGTLIKEVGHTAHDTGLVKELGSRASCVIYEHELVILYV